MEINLLILKNDSIHKSEIFKSLVSKRFLDFAHEKLYTSNIYNTVLRDNFVSRSYYATVIVNI